MVDVHCHLADERYDEDLEGVVKRADKAGVMMISCGINLENSIKTIEIAQKFENVWACVGIHPEEIINFKFSIFNELKNLTRQKKVVGFGEIGLDYRVETSERDRKKQRELFEAQLQLAEEFKLPVQVHNRGADEDVWRVVTQHKVTGVMHCFTRSQDFMRKCTEAGWTLSFGGLLTYDHNQKMQKVMMTTPETSLLLETDSPYSVPKPLSTEVNEPANIWTIAETMAKLRQVSIERINRVATDNAIRIFNIKN